MVMMMMMTMMTMIDDYFVTYTEIIIITINVIYKALIPLCSEYAMMLSVQCNG